MPQSPNQKISIPSGCNGPANSANGGYVSGLLGTRIDGATEVVLHAPPPLETSLKVTQTNNGLQLYSQGILLAEATSHDFDLTVPTAPTLAAAQAARIDYIGHRYHDYPTCFVCGTDRHQGDGLCLYCGPVKDHPQQIVACDWIPGARLADSDGRLDEKYIWCALDCPGAQAKQTFTGKPYGYVVRLAVQVFERPVIDVPLIVTGWLIDSDQRKHTCGTALFSEEGKLLAQGKALWIDLKKEP